MKYAVKTYQNEFLDDHATIEADERNRWGIIVQPDKEQIKANFSKKSSQPDFDPEMQLYAFNGDRMVGFITSSLFEEDGITISEVQIPFIVEGYEDVRDLLLDRLIGVLRSKGVTFVRAMVSEYWGETISIAKRNGFRFHRDIVIQSQKPIEEIENLINPKNVQDFDYQKHAEVVTELVMKLHEVSEEEAHPVVARYKDWAIGEIKNPSGTRQKLVTHGLIIHNGVVVGRALGFQQEQSGEKTVDLAMYAQDNDKDVLGQLLSAGIRDSNKLGMEVIHIGLQNPTDELRRFYSSYGFNFRTAAAYYCKEI